MEPSLLEDAENPNDGRAKNPLPFAAFFILLIRFPEADHYIFFMMQKTRKNKALEIQ